MSLYSCIDAWIASFMNAFLLSPFSCSVFVSWNVNLHYVQNVIYGIMIWESPLIPTKKKLGQRSNDSDFFASKINGNRILVAFGFSARPCKSQIQHSSSFDHTLYRICYWTDTMRHDVNLMSTNSTLISNQIESKCLYTNMTQISWLNIQTHCVLCAFLLKERRERERKGVSSVRMAVNSMKSEFYVIYGRDYGELFRFGQLKVRREILIVYFVVT